MQTLCYMVYMWGTSVTPTANPLSTRFTSLLPTIPRPPRLPVCLYIYTPLPTNELYTLSWFLALLIVDGRSECPLGTLSSAYL